MLLKDLKFDSERTGNILKILNMLDFLLDFEIIAGNAKDFEAI